MMSIATLLLAAVAVLGCTSTALAEEGAQFRYRGWLENESLTIQEPDEGASSGWIVIGDDGFEPTEFCEEESRYICFFSRRFSFAVPKRLDSSTSKWTVRDVEFELSKNELSVSIFGRQLDGLLLIKTPAEATAAGRETGKPAYFLYSPRAGLVGFGLDPLPDGAATTYWMVDSAGFGAAKR